jgi:uncharacterized protein involved in response to NO
VTPLGQRGTWTGPAVFACGFRPFFFCAALWAAVSMALWSGMLLGEISLPIRPDPLSWHAHEFLFGYLGAVIAGFLLTAVPNWTGRLPLAGWPLAALLAVWIAGRLAYAVSAGLPNGVPEAIDLLFGISLAVVILREIVAGRNWRNLIVLLLLAGLIVSNLLFHLETFRGELPAQGLGMRLGISTVLLMIALIGGRIVPAFTRNWLVKAGHADLPTPPMQGFDKAVMLVTLVVLLQWSFRPDAVLSGAALLIMAALHTVRLARWKGHRTVAEPLLWVLHLGYFLVPLGGVFVGFAILEPRWLDAGAAQHIWMAGAFGLMTLAVMIRATLGHTGQALTAGRGSQFVFLGLIGSVGLRLAAGISPQLATPLYAGSAVLWIAVFSGFCLLFGKSLFGAETDQP